MWGPHGGELGDAPLTEGDELRGCQNTMDIENKHRLFPNLPIINATKQNQVIQVVCLVVSGVHWGPLGEENGDAPLNEGDKVE